MRRCLPFFLVLPVLLLAQSAEPLFEPLTDQEADALVAAEMVQKANERLDFQTKFEVLKQREITDGDSSLILNTVRKPASHPVAETMNKASEVSDWLNYQDEINASELLSLTVFVYDKSISRIHWQHEKQQYVLWVATDLNDSQWIREFQSGDQHYLTSVFILNFATSRYAALETESGQKSLIENERQIPQLPDGATDTDLYLELDGLFSLLPANEETQGVYDFLVYFKAQRKRLEVVSVNAQKLSLARKRYNAARSQSTPVVLYYYTEK